MEFLTRMEEILLLTVHQLGTEAYGVTIKARVEELLGKSVSVGAIYVPLDRLTKHGLLKTWQGESSPERGGRSKKFYKLTRDGLAILRETKALSDSLWADATV
ncbi:MAG: PadR family transcriptional regulator [Anaerolineae bacterium]|nr:PadR family transcriptional regulator [Anaerolineae bacterium]MCI0609981.1 PadR family transcriptional regulator [Anaerolineae bacterium]